MQVIVVSSSCLIVRVVVIELVVGEANRIQKASVVPNLEQQHAIDGTIRDMMWDGEDGRCDATDGHRNGSDCYLMCGKPPSCHYTRFCVLLEEASTGVN